MRKLWGRATSSNVMKVMWLLDELGQPFELVPAGLAFGRTHDADYVAMNPNSRVPTLQEDDFTLWESNVILRYLAAQHAAGSALWPGDARARARVDQWLDWQQTTLNAPMAVVFQGLVRTAPDARDMPAIQAGAAEAAQCWGVLDRQMAGHAYVAGPDFTLADIPLGVSAHRWFALDLDRPETPHVRAWYERLLARPAYRDRCARPLA